MTNLCKFSLLTLILTGCSSKTDDYVEDNSGSNVRMETSMGDFVIELYTTNAPETTDNFLRYVDAGFYDGSDGKGATTFHRVIRDFMAQGGGITVDGLEKTTFDPIPNEAANSGLSNVRGTVAMARTTDPDSATAQFFVNVLDNVYLDAGATSPDGYAVFGRIISGMDTFDEMELVEVDDNDMPLEPIVINKAMRVSDDVDFQE